MSTWTFEPMVNGEKVIGEDGKPVTIDVEVEGEADKVDVALSVDGQVIESNYLLPDKVYQVLKWVALLLLPTLAWVSTMLCNTWNLPYGPEIAATITAVATFLGAILGVSHIQYKKGDN